MSQEIKKWLTDIQKSIDVIDEYLRDVPDLSSYKSSLKTMDAVTRRLSIIGEALWNANKRDNTLAISNKHKIISLRHIIVHDYDIVDDSAIWIIYKRHLPILKTEVELILNSK